MDWITEGFEGFSKGTMENGGQNLYVSKKGVLQRIFQYDVNGDGFADLLFACSQSMYERPPLYVFEQLPQGTDHRELPSGGTYDGVFADLSGSGYDDLVVACQHDGTHSDVTAFVYFGSHEGLTERYRMELPAPSSVGVAVGDFNGNERKDIAFLSNEKLRVFEQEERGFCPANFTDYPLNAKVIVAAGIFIHGMKGTRLAIGIVTETWGLRATWRAFQVSRPVTMYSLWSRTTYTTPEVRDSPWDVTMPSTANSSFSMACQTRSGASCIGICFSTSYSRDFCRPPSSSRPPNTNVAAGQTQARSLGPPGPVRAAVRRIHISR